MTLYWIGDAILLLVVAPIAVVLLKGVLDTARGIVPNVERIANAAESASRDLDAVPLLLSTQEHVIKTVETIADYGGSLNVIVDDG